MNANRQKDENSAAPGMVAGLRKLVSAWLSDSPDTWREKILFGVYASGVVLGAVAYGPIMLFLISGGSWLVAAVDTLMLVWGVTSLLLWKRLPYRLKANVALVSFYFIGVTVLYSLGPYSGGPVWLFCFSVVSGVVLGVRASLLAIAINALTLVAIGCMLDYGLLAWGTQHPRPLQAWAIISINFLLLNTIVAISVAVAARGLEVAIGNEKSARQDLDRERLRLSELNQELIRSGLELNEKARLFQAAFDIAPTGMMIIAPDLSLLQVNYRICRMLGYRSAELLNLNFEDLIHLDEKERFKRILMESLIRGQDASSHLEARFLDDKGAVIWALTSTSLVKDAEGNALYFVCHLLDVTDRRNADQALKKSKERYRSLVQNVPYGLFTAELPDGNMLFINQKMRELFDYPESQIKGLSIWDALDTGEHQRAEHLIEALANGEIKEINHVFTGIRKGGETFRFEATVSLIRHQGRKALQGFVLDVTERENLESQLRHAQKMEALGTLAGGISHDFNNTLGVVMGYTELALEKIDEGETCRDELELVLKSAGRARDLVSQILTFSRKLETTFQVIELNRLVTDIVRMMEGAFAKTIGFQVLLTPAGSQVEGDPVQLEQVILNLCANASDAMQGSGTIRIQTSEVALDREFCKSHVEVKPGRYLLLTVTDHGEGMPRKVQEQIFDPFFTTKNLGQGTGLGLSTVYGVVRNHNGLVLCQSDPGRGTEFSIYLPQTAMSAVNLPADIHQARPPKGSGETILVVDDEASIRDVTSRSLGRAGYRVITAEDAETGLTIYAEKAEEISLVVLDLGMPGLGGHKCLDLLKEMDPKVKVVIVSGYTMDKRLKDTVAKASGYLPKPIRKEHLLAELSRVLAGGGEPKSAPAASAVDPI